MRYVRDHLRNGDGSGVNVGEHISTAARLAYVLCVGVGPLRSVDGAPFETDKRLPFVTPEQYDLRVIGADAYLDWLLMQ